MGCFNLPVIRGDFVSLYLILYLEPVFLHVIVKHWRVMHTRLSLDCTEHCWI